MHHQILRYMEDKLRQKDQLMEKLRLKNAALKAQKGKVRATHRRALVHTFTWHLCMHACGCT
jgi:hypothetical protein